MPMFRTCSLQIVGGGPLVQYTTKRNGMHVQMLRHANKDNEEGIEICGVENEFVYHHVTGLHGDQKDTKGRLRGNHNGDFMWWRRTLLAKRGDRLHAYETWRGGDVFENHDEEAPFGYIPDVWPDFQRKSIDMLMATSRSVNPKLVEAIEKGRIKDVSMGAIVGHSYCSIQGCFRHAQYKNPNITEDDYCEHLRHLKGQFLAEVQAWVYEDNRDIFGVEVSWITQGVGADPDAKLHHVVHAQEQLDSTHVVRSMNTSVVDLYGLKGN